MNTEKLSMYAFLPIFCAGKVLPRRRVLRVDAGFGLRKY